MNKVNSNNQICSPYSTVLSENNQSCYTMKNLLILRNSWNLRHPNDKILSDDFNEIWQQLNDKMSHVCNNERCWIKKLTYKLQIDYETFAPNRPKSWIKNPREWLSNKDISKIMNQYEKIYKFFEFIGPSPLNYYEFDQDLNDYVWPELKHFDLDKYLKRNISDIGIVFNLDDHDEPGSHWVTLYIDLNNHIIYFFDSAAGTIPKNVKCIIDKVKNNNYEIQFKTKTNYPLEHQSRDGECGMYSIYFLTEMISKNKSWDYFSKQKIPDKEMEKLRNKLFN